MFLNKKIYFIFMSFGLLEVYSKSVAGVSDVNVQSEVKSQKNNPLGLPDFLIDEYQNLKNSVKHIKNSVETLNSVNDATINAALNLNKKYSTKVNPLLNEINNQEEKLFLKNYLNTLQTFIVPEIEKITREINNYGPEIKSIGFQFDDLMSNNEKNESKINASIGNLVKCITSLISKIDSGIEYMTKLNENLNQKLGKEPNSNLSQLSVYQEVKNMNNNFKNLLKSEHVKIYKIGNYFYKAGSSMELLFNQLNVNNKKINDLIELLKKISLKIADVTYAIELNVFDRM